jgi:hypothetical protein
MVSLLRQHTHPLSIHRVHAHTHILGNDEVDTLAKAGTKKSHRLPSLPNEFAHSTPYWLHRNEWPSSHCTSCKGPIRHLHSYLDKYNKDKVKDLIFETSSNIQKWVNDENIDLSLSNAFWTMPSITDSQISQLLKFRYGQYMGLARKLLFWPHLYPSMACPLCRNNDTDTWLHVLLKCIQPIIHGLRVKRHNHAVWELRNLLVSNTTTRCFTLMNASLFNNCRIGFYHFQLAFTMHLSNFPLPF